MAIRYLTAEQHRVVLSQLLALGRSIGDCKAPHAAGIEYTSLMYCFLLHNLSIAESLLRLWQSFGPEWFPATAGYLIARSMFETDVTAHYISQSPTDRAHQYILFERVLEKREMDSCAKHRRSKDPQWREGMDLIWQNRWVQRENQVNAKFNEVRHIFEATGKNGQTVKFRNWSGKQIREMAVEVNHEESYDIFYAELSSFTHVDVRLANHFLRLNSDGMLWSQRAREFDVGNVFRYAVTFLDCFLKCFGQQFGAWDSHTVDTYWDLDTV